jgi:intracellular multiplication protein IcmP
MFSQYGRGGDQGRAGEDTLLLAAIIAVFIGAFLVAAWYLFHAQIAAATISLQHGLMRAAGAFTGRYASLDAQVLAADPAAVRFGALWRLLHNVGTFYRYPAAALIALLAIACFIFNAPGQFTRNLDLAALMGTLAGMFPQSAAYVTRGLGLTTVADAAPRPADPSLHAGRALLAVFALHAARRRDDAMALLGDLSGSLPDGKEDGPGGPAAPLVFSPAVIAKADRILSDHDLLSPCLAEAGRHAFTAPALMAVLTFARQQSGVLAPAQFAFLKLVDRRLWYALHSLGFPGGQNPAEQPNPRIEAIGARDHWAAESALGQRLAEPSFDRALAVIRARAHAAPMSP